MSNTVITFGRPDGPDAEPAPPTRRDQVDGQNLPVPGAGEFIWVDMHDNPPEEDVRILSERFGAHPLAIQDALRVRHPPKFEHFAATSDGPALDFVLLRGLDAASGDIDFGVIQLAIFVGPDFVVTRHVKRSLSVEWLMDAVQRDQQRPPDPISVLTLLVSRLVRRYVEVVLSLEPRLEAIEQTIYSANDDGLLAELTSYKFRLRELRRIASYHEVIAGHLLASPRYASHQHEITDIAEQLNRTVSLADLHYTMAADLIDGYIAVASHRLNHVMKILTIFTVIFVPLTFIAGIYGMNFENIPELRSRNGYFVVLSVMTVIGLVLLYFFRRRRWI